MEGSWEDFRVDRPSTESQWTADELDALLETWSSEVGLPVPNGVMSSYLTALLEGDDECPGSGDDIIGALSGCTASTGWSYSGLAIYSRTEEETLDTGMERSVVSASFDNADFVVTSPEGQRFVGGGRTLHSWEKDPSSDVQTLARFSGTWSHDWTGLSWLAEPVSVDAEYSYAVGSDKTGLLVSGSMTAGGRSLVWEKVDVFHQECPGSARGGQLWVRQDDGSWVLLAFDETCSGCATAVWNDESELGEVCPDFTELAASAGRSLGAAP